jgi:hypothetical protein
LDWYTLKTLEPPGNSTSIVAPYRQAVDADRAELVGRMNDFGG